MQIIIDLGTTNTKIYLVKDNKIIQKEQFTTSPINKELLDLEYIEHNILTILQKMFFQVTTNIQIIFTGAMHTIVVLDKNGKELIPATNLLFVNYKIENSIKNFQNRTGMIEGKHLPVFRLKYLISQNELILNNIDKVMSIKSYLIWKWTSYFKTELSEASGLGLLNLKTKDWDYDIFTQYNFRTNWFGELTKYSTQVKGYLLDKFIEIFYGLSDGVSIGKMVGEHLGNVISITTGTTLGIRTITKKDISLHDNQTYLLPISHNEKLIGITSNNGSNNLEYLSNKIKVNLNKFPLALKESNQINTFYYPTVFTERYQLEVNYKYDLDYLINTYNHEQVIYTVYEGLSFMIRYLTENLQTILQEKKQPLILTGGLLSNNLVKNFIALKIQHDFYTIENFDIGVYASLNIITNVLNLKNKIKKYKYIKNERSDERYNSWKRNIKTYAKS